MEKFYKKYYLSVRGFVAKKIDDEGVVEEITNDVLLAAINSMENFNGRCSEFSWICSIAKHKVIDYYRKKKIKTILFSVNPMFEEIADKALNPERDALKNELKEEIKKTFKEMKAGYKNILRLKYIEGWKVDDIAKKNKLSVKAVESRLMRARKQFKEAWIYDQKED
ncbi:MAG: sigma-70 family RNA polymerase sigma factor [Candidatus Shapirobacteria bacterium]|nr:sigma-70 family RNA polymerase sigma factor [Candidatus Shapirobacteria bacterium]